MPMYQYQCLSCEIEFDKMVPLAQYDQPQPCEDCGKETRKLLAMPGVIFKGDSWGTKNGRVAGQMREKNKRLKAKERDYKGDGMIPSLAPNVEGERVSSWSEASKLAKDKGKNTSGYDKMARKEKAG
jgi:putative FmdB family regulatory protein